MITRLDGLEGGGKNMNLAGPTDLVTISITGDKLFPTCNYNDVQKLVVSKFGDNSSYDDFAYSWNALGHRFHGAINISQSLIASLGPPPMASTPETRHQQDQELFYFFSSLYSSIECLYYSAFAIGGMTTAEFDFGNPKIQRKIKPDFVVSRFNRLLPGTTISEQLQRSIKTDRSCANVYDELVQIRNVLSHRSQPGRTFGWSGHDDPTTMWQKFDIPLDSILIAKHRDYLGKITNKIVSELYAYIQNHNKPN